jgi:hypothetical protein
LKVGHVALLFQNNDQRGRSVGNVARRPVAH